MATVWIGIALGAIAAMTAGLAGHLAAQKDWHKWVFWIAAAVIVGLLFVQGHYVRKDVRDAEERGKRQQAQLDQIEKNTASPPHVTVNIPASPLPEQRLGSLSLTKVEFPPSWQVRPYVVNLHLVNVGQVPIDDAYPWETVSFERVGTLSSLDDSERANRQVYSKLLKMAQDAVRDAKRAGHPPLYFAIEDDHPHPFPLHPDMMLINDMVVGTWRLYFFAYAEWDGGKQKYIACRWLERLQSPDESATGYVLNDCAW